LQYGRALALTQSREQHQLSIWEFQCIMMDCSVVYVDLSEACEPLPKIFAWENASPPFAFDIIVECDLGPRQQTDRYIRLTDGSEAASDGILETTSHQLVLGLCRPGSNSM
jgi:hypothetical protein